MCVCAESNDQAKEQLQELQGVEEEKKKAEENAKKAQAEAEQAIAGMYIRCIFLISFTYHV